MITEIRKQFKAQGFKVILGLVLIAMCISFLPVFKQQGPGERGAIMTINKAVINPMEFERKTYQINERLQFFSQQLGIKFDLKGINIRSIAIQSLIEETLLNQVSRKLNFVISPLILQYKLNNPEYVMYELADVVPWYVIKDGQINDQALNHYLQTMHLSMGEFEEMIEQAMKRALIKDVAGISTYILPNEIKDYFMQHYVSKTFKILTFPFAQFVQQAKMKQLSTEDIQNFFGSENAKSKRYWIPEQRAGKAWVFTPETYEIQVTDEDIKNYYDTNKLKKYVDKPVELKVRRIVFEVGEDATPEQVREIEERAQRVLEQAKLKPESFAQLAKEYSMDEKSKAAGGLTDFFQKGQMNPEFEKAAFRLKENGDISDVVVTDRGLEIIQRVDRNPITFKSLESVKNAVKEQLRKQKFNVQFSNDMNRLMQQADEHSKTVDTFAQSKKAQSEIIALSKKQDSPIAQKMFRGKQGDWSYFFHEGKGYALQITEIKKRYEPNLADVKQQVKSDLEQANAVKAYEAAIKKAEKLAQAKPLEEVQKELGGTIQAVGPVKRGDKEKLDAVERKGISVNALFTLSKEQPITSEKTDDQAAIIKLIDTGVFDQGHFNQVKGEIAKILDKERSADVIQGFVASLYRSATIKMMDTDNDN